MYCVCVIVDTRQWLRQKNFPFKKNFNWTNKTCQPTWNFVFLLFVFVNGFLYKTQQRANKNEFFAIFNLQLVALRGAPYRLSYLINPFLNKSILCSQFEPHKTKKENFFFCTLTIKANYIFRRILSRPWAIGLTRVLGAKVRSEKYVK